jgi:hypothetical protein
MGHVRTSGGLSDPSEGVRITNFTPNLAADDRSSPPMKWLRSFPSEGVALQIWFLGDGLGVPWTQPSTLPLSPKSFKRSPPYSGGSEPDPLYRSFNIDGFTFFAAIWFGPRSRRAERQAIWSAVSSLHFPRLREGTVWEKSWYVLGPASRYPTGSVTLFPRSAFPRRQRFLFRRSGGFYLVHDTRRVSRVQGRVYGLEHTFETPVPPNSRCRVKFDRSDSQFFCSRTHLRWDETGQAIGAHAGNPNWELGPLAVTKAQDGNLLVYV